MAHSVSKNSLNFGKFLHTFSRLLSFFFTVELYPRYQFSRKSTLRPEEFEAFGIEKKQPGEVTMETEYEKVKSLDIDNWEPIRGPRPWEENTIPDKVKDKLPTKK